MKKKVVLVSALSVVSLGAVTAAAACKDPVDPPVAELAHYVYFEAAEGVTYDCDVKSGARVSDGFVLSFSVSVADGYDDSMMRVYASNSTEALTVDEATYTYSVTVSSDVTISVGGVSAPVSARNYDVTFNVGSDEDGADARISYYINGEKVNDKTISVKGGESVSFSLETSVYYNPEKPVTVLANTQTVAEKDGLYTFTVMGNTNVRVTGLVQDDDFITRGDGSGTVRDPYRISRPVDLFTMAGLVNSDFYTGYGFQFAHYRLENDIDMKGEQLYIIGAYNPETAPNAIFCGDFNGNGHAIKNYYLTNYEIDQSNYQPVYMQYVGLFGYTVALQSGMAEIYDLTLENFEVEAFAPNNENLFVGGIAGYAIGTNFTACKVDGDINVHAGNNFAYIGGVAGVFQSAFSETVSYIPYIRYTESNVNIENDRTTGYARAAGGLAGYVISAAEQTPAIILNSFSTGDIAGAYCCGGIAGISGAYSGIANCYATGAIESNNDRSDAGASSSLDIYFNSDAGGIVGYAQYNSSVSGCFFTGEVYSSAASGGKFEHTDGIIGNISNSSEKLIDSYDAIATNNLSTVATKYGTVQPAINSDIAKTVLKWDEADWKFDGKYPVINHEEATKTITVTLNFGGVAANRTVTIENSYAPVAYWYASDDVDMPEFIDAAGKRSYGYFFDSELKKPVPVGYVPMSDIELFVGFADYNEVAGNYYVQTNDHRTVRIALGADGSAVLVDGAMSRGSDYYYNGEYIILRQQPLSYLFIEREGITDPDDLTTDQQEFLSNYLNFKAVAEGGELSITDTIFFNSAPLKASKEIAGFKYGEYKAGNRNYDFRRDGFVYMGSIVSPYALVGNDIVIESGAIRCTLSEGVITKIGTADAVAADGFIGTWVSGNALFEAMTLDGYGNWTLESYYYDNTGVKTTVTLNTGSYTVGANGVTLSDCKYTTANFDGENLLVVDGKTFGFKDEFAGVWRYFASNMDGGNITLYAYGLAADGIGTGRLSYSNGSYDVRYTVSDGTMTVYYLDNIFAELEFDNANYTLSGRVYSDVLGGYITNTVMYRYDDFRGNRIVSSESGIAAISINGLGVYNVSGSNAAIAVRGRVTLTLADGNTVTAAYTINRADNTVRFTYDGVEYTVSLDGNEIILTGAAANPLLSYDGFEDLVLMGEDGTVYTFNGRDTVGEGKMIITPASGAATEVPYTVENGAISLLTVNAQGYFEYEGKKLITVNEFTGEWAFSLSEGPVYFTIGDMNMSDNSFKGVVDGEETTFLYNAVNGVEYLSFTHGGEDMYLYVLPLGGLLMSYEFDLNKPEQDAFGIYDFLSIRVSDLDKYQGTHASDNGTLYFDGFSTNNYYYAYATLISGGEKKIFSYHRATDVVTGKEFVVLEDTEGGPDRRLREAENGGYTIGGVKYELVIQDDLHAYRAYYTVANDNGVEIRYAFYFDGYNSFNAYDVDRTDKTEYWLEGSYVITGGSIMSGEFTLELTTYGGKKYIAVIKYSTNTVLSLTEVK